MKKILLIDDDENLENAFQLTFSKAYQFFSSTQGEKGISEATRLHPDLIILDIMLSGKINGFDVLQELKNNPQTKDIPVLVLTNLEGQQKTALDLGAIECLEKSKVEMNDIVKKVNQILS